MSYHTPGPWTAVFVSGAGWKVRMLNPRPGYKEPDPICSMAWFQFDIPGIIDDEISGSNARLIAAAPDLLAACELLIRGRDSEATIAAERAVKKARGE